jgi:8-oxo-dGTP pyrophosphatase MutT (NUDIX family)
MLAVRHHLTTLLTEHLPADDLESVHRGRMLDLATDDGDPFSRQSFEPGHFTASAFVVSPDLKSMLMILHSKLGLWLQPGGHIDPEDADVTAAARREVVEETGVSSLEPLDAFPNLLDLDIHPIPANPRKGEPPHEHFDVRVALRATTWEFEAGSDAQAARWVPLAEVDEIGTDESVRRALRKLRAAVEG